MWRPHQISFCFAVTYAMKFVFCFICAIWFSWCTHKYLFICHVNRVTLQKPIHPLLPWLWCGESLYAPITNLPDVFLDPSHPSCHLSSYYSLNSQMKLLFHLTRSWIAWARNLEARRLFLLSAARRMWKWSSVQVEGPQFTAMPSVRWWPVDKGVTESKTDKWQHEVMNDTCCLWIQTQWDLSRGLCWIYCATPIKVIQAAIK